MMMAITAAAQYTEENAKLSQFEKTRTQVSLFLSFITEGKPGRDYTSRQNTPFFRQLKERELLAVFSGIAISSLKLDGTQEWPKENEAGVTAYLTFVRDGK